MKILYFLFFFISSNLVTKDLIRGGGLNYCGYLINTINQHSQFSGMWKQWITGFISGYNIANNKQNIKNIEDDLIFYAVRDRCIEYPKETVAEATIWILKNN